MPTIHRQQSTPGPGPRFYVWHRDILHLPTIATQPAPHRVVHDKLMISLDGWFHITVDGQRRRTRSCLLATGQWHTPDTIDDHEAVTATLLLPPLSQDFPALASLMTRVSEGFYYDHPEESRLIGELLHGRNTPDPVSERIRQQLYRTLIPHHLASQVFRVIDPRVIRVVRQLQQTACTNVPLEHLATEVGLSASYLEKLFKEHTGVPVTQYRLRYRVYVASILLGMGHSITDAALKSGFSSSSHFSRTYRSLTGETASQMFFKSGAQTLIEQRVTRSVLQVIRDLPAITGRTRAQPD